MNYGAGKSMTREELRKHCEKQIEHCEKCAREGHNREELHRKVYEEHKLILELLEQEPFINKPCVSTGVCEHDKNVVLDKIRAEIANYQKEAVYSDDVVMTKRMVLAIIDKYKTESEDNK